MSVSELDFIIVSRFRVEPTFQKKKSGIFFRWKIVYIIYLIFNIRGKTDISHIIVDYFSIILLKYRFSFFYFRFGFQYLGLGLTWNTIFRFESSITDPDSLYPSIPLMPLLVPVLSHYMAVCTQFPINIIWKFYGIYIFLRQWLKLHKLYDPILPN